MQLKGNIIILVGLAEGGVGGRETAGEIEGGREREKRGRRNGRGGRRGSRR